MGKQVEEYNYVFLVIRAEIYRICLSIPPSIFMANLSALVNHPSGWPLGRRDTSDGLHGSADGVRMGHPARRRHSHMEPTLFAVSPLN